MAFRRRLLGLSATATAGFRRSLATATSHPPWAMMSIIGEAVRTPSVDVRLTEPPQVSKLCFPEHLIKTKGSPDPASGVQQELAGGIRAVSGDGLLLLSYVDLRFTARTGGEKERTGLDPAHIPSVTRFVCNPVTRELSRLPDSMCNPMGDLRCDRQIGLVTQADRGHGPPDRFAVAVLEGNMMIRFLSETGEWEIVEVSPCRLPLARRMELCSGAQAFGGRLWWVDVTWGAISADPFSDRPELSFVQLPRGSVLPPAGDREQAGPVMYRRVGVSEGRLRYVEVSQEEPFLLSSYVLDEEGDGWTLEHRVVLNKIWGPSMWIPLQMKGTTSIVLIHPLDANVVYLMVMKQIVVVNMEKEEVIESCPYGGGDAPCIPSVRPPWLGSSRIPSAAGKKDVEKNNALADKKDAEKNKTLADVLVRSAGHYKRRRCPMARDLWQAMAEVWPLPEIKDMSHADSEWLLRLLEEKTETVRMMILLTLWRIWYCRNEVVHNKPAPSTESSKGFLCSYLQSLLTIKHCPEADPVKGKSAMAWEDLEEYRKKRKDKSVATQKPWRKPPKGCVKLNIDGSFCARTATGGTGAVLRDEVGSIIMSACRHLSFCSSPLEAELVACRDGIALALDWSTSPCLVEMDCPEAVKMIRSGELDRSPFTGLVQESKHLLASRSSLWIDSIDRAQNNVFLQLTDVNWEADGGGLLILWKSGESRSTHCISFQGKSGSIIRLSVHSRMF